MKALITGAGGFIGSFLLEELINKGYVVRALFMPEENADAATKLGAEIVRGDLTQPETLKNIAHGVDVVFHLATRVVDWGSIKLFRSVMVDGTRYLLEESKNNASRFIYFSSIAALGLNRDLVGMNEDAKREKTGIPYCDTKIDAENLVADFCRDNNMPYTIIRPANVIGPGSAWVRDILDTFFRGPFPLVAGGKAPGAFVYVKNLIDGTILASESEKAKGKTYHFRDDFDITWKEYIETLGSWVGQKPFGSIPFKPAYILGSFMEKLLTPLGIRPPMTRLAAGVIGKNNDVDISRAKEDLKWQTRIPLHQAMDEIKEWVMENYTTPGVGSFKDFHNRTVFITGGSSGIGLEIARMVVSKGAHVALFARDIKKLQNASEDIQSTKRNQFQKIVTISADITDVDDVHRKTEEAIGKLGKPDILINSAGINRSNYFENLSYNDFDDVYKTNVYGTRNMIAALLPAMKEKGGHIVNISSAAGLMGMFGYTAYGSSKFALVGFSECLRSEMKQHNIHVSVVCPPEVKTPMIIEEAKTIPPEALAVKKLAGALKPESVAKTVIKGIMKNKFLVIPGIKCRLLYVSQKLSPGWMSRFTSDFVVKRKQGKKAGRNVPVETVYRLVTRLGNKKMVS